MGLFALEEEANLFFYSMRQRSKRYVQTDSNWMWGSFFNDKVLSKMEKIPKENNSFTITWNKD